MPAEEHQAREPGHNRLQGDGATATAAPPAPPAVPAPRRRRLRWVILGAVALLVLAAAALWGIPYLRTWWTTESTDDAYVNSHVTNIAPRVEDNVTAVLVDNGYFVEPGTVLARLDPEPYQVIVNQRQAALEVAQAQLGQTEAEVRAEEAKGRASWYQLLAAQDQVRYQIATLKANIADLKLAQANLTYAQQEYQRVSKLATTGAATAEELQQRLNAQRVAESQVNSAEQAVQRTRAALGLPPDTKNPLDVPKDLDQTYSGVQVALSNAAVALAGIGMPLQLHDLTPKALHDQLAATDVSGDINRALDKLVAKSPQVLLARSKVSQAQHDLEQARLNLGYTVIRSEIAGVVNQRNVNPGDHVLPGQDLMTVRSVEQVWIDANFKETQLDRIVIGLPVDIAVDAYPHRTFHGRVAGFTPATGSVAALLPPENATGNFVKVVQRLPVRIELTEPNPRDTPLFAGLSVVPYVRLNAKPEGPNAGERIRTAWQAAAPEQPAAPPASPPAPPVPAGRRTPAGAPGAAPAPRGAGKAGAGGLGPPPVRQGAGPIMP